MKKTYYIEVKATSGLGKPFTATTYREAISQQDADKQASLFAKDYTGYGWTVQSTSATEAKS